MPNTVEGYINGKPLNPNRDLPHRTLAQAQAEGLTSSNRLWVRTDGQNTPINASQIAGRLVKSIPANTFSTYALALADLETTYDSLTDEEKVKSVIIRGDRIIYRLNYRLGKVYIYTSLDSLNMNIQSFDLSNHKYYQGQLSTTPAFVVNENTNGSQSEKLDLYII